MTIAEIIQRMREEAAWATNIERQTLAKRLIDYYNGRQLNDLETVIRAQFRKPDNLLVQLVMHNIVQFIGDEISRVFDGSPLIKPANDGEREQEFLAHVSQGGRLNLYLKMAEVYANLARVCAIHSFFDDKKQQIEHLVMPSSCLWVFQRDGNPRDYEAVTYSQEYNSLGMIKTEYIHWDTEFAFRFSSEQMGAQEPLLGAQNVLNPYGIIPFAFFRDQVAEGDFWGEISDYLINAQDTLNVMLTEKKYLEKMQSFSVPVLEGWEGKTTPKYVDPSTPLCVPPSMSDEGRKTFRFETPQARLTELQESIRQHQNMVFDSFGIYVEATKQAQSGYSLKLRNQRLDRRREDNLPLMKAGLIDLLENDRVLWNTHFPAKAIPDPIEWQIDMKEPEYNEEPYARLAAEKLEVDLGIKSLVDLVLARNPDMAPEEAEKKVAANLTRWQSEKRRYGLASLLTGSSAPGGSNNGQ